MQGTWVWYTDPKTKALIGGQIVEVLAAGKDYQIRTYDNNVRCARFPPAGLRR